MGDKEKCPNHAHCGIFVQHWGVENKDEATRFGQSMKYILPLRGLVEVV